jgi:hypothetical protein
MPRVFYGYDLRHGDGEERSMRLDSGCDELPCWAGFRGVEGDEDAHHETQFVCEEQWAVHLLGLAVGILGPTRARFFMWPPVCGEPG